MNYTEVVESMALGNKVTRESWKGTVTLKMDAAGIVHADMSNATPFPAMLKASSIALPWIATESDMEATDWRIV